MIGWLPLTARAMDTAALAAVQPEVQACLRLAAPAGRAQAQDLLRAMYLYLPWVLRNRETLARRVVWHSHTVDDYLDDIKNDYSVEWRQNHRIFLARVGRRVNPAAWPRRTPLARSPFAEPYSAEMEGALCLAAELRCLQQGTVAEIFATVASLGAGMAGTEIPGIEPRHIINLTEDRLAILVSGEFARVAPIRSPYTRLAELAIEVAGGRAFIPKPAKPNTSDNAVYRAAGACRRPERGPLEFPTRPEHVAGRAPSRRDRTAVLGEDLSAGEG